MLFRGYMYGGDRDKKRLPADLKRQKWKEEWCFCLGCVFCVGGGVSMARLEEIL